MKFKISEIKNKINKRENNMNNYIEKNSLKNIEELLQNFSKKFTIKRHKIEWPVFLFENPENNFTIKNTKNILKLYEEINKYLKNGELHKFFEKYSYIPEKNIWKE